MERKRNQLDEVEAELADIAAGRDATRGRCDELQEMILINSRRLERAKSLPDSLESGGELQQPRSLFVSEVLDHLPEPSNTAHAILSRMM